jgi:uncharacterized repeat protein (TIGR03803 family)
VLYEFAIDGSDGQPLGIIRDSVGNFYGTTSGRRTFGYGKIFKLDSTGNFATLYNFSGTPNDLGSTGGLIQDPSSGTLYGPGGTYSLTGNIFQLIP